MCACTLILPMVLAEAPRVWIKEDWSNISDENLQKAKDSALINLTTATLMIQKAKDAISSLDMNEPSSKGILATNLRGLFQAALYILGKDAVSELFDTLSPFYTTEPKKPLIYKFDIMKKALNVEERTDKDKGSFSKEQSRGRTLVYLISSLNAVKGLLDNDKIEWGKNKFFVPSKFAQEDGQNLREELAIAK